MSDTIPVLEGEALSEEDNLLIAIMQDMKKGQIDFLDAGAKRLIELISVLLGVLLATLTIGDQYPPDYLSDNIWGKIFALLTLVLYIGAMFGSLMAIQPRRYKFYSYNLTQMKQELEKIIADKSWWLFVGGACFMAGSAALGLLLATLILSA